MSPALRRTIERMRCCILRGHTRHDVATVRQSDLEEVLDLLAVVLSAYEAQSGIIAHLMQPGTATATTHAAVVEPRLCTRHDCAVSR